MGGDFQPHPGRIARVSAVAAVRERTDEGCHATVCRDGGCSLSVANLPDPSVLISLEHEAAPVDRNQPHCDYLFVGGEGDEKGAWVAPIELTAGPANVSKFLPQLKAGAAIADKLLPRDVQVRFRPIAVYRGEFRRTERHRFLQPASRVNFRNKRSPVTLVRCGSPLAKALRG